MKTKTVMIVCLAFAAGLTALAQGSRDTGWPRIRTAPDGTRVVIHQPQVDQWDFYVKLDFRVAVEIWLPGAKAGIPAAVQMTAETTTDLSKRTVVVYNQKVVRVNFPSADEDTARKLSTLLTGLVQSAPMKLSLDEVLAYVVPAGTEPADAPAPAAPAPEVRTIPVQPDPPVILYSQTPAVLVLFDGDPVFTPVKDTGLLFAVNTNWDLFQEEGKPNYYLLNTDTWYQAPAPTGPWAPAGKLPKGLWSLPKESNWADVQKNLPGRTTTKAKMPLVYVSVKPAELILLKGAPVLKPVTGTKLQWVSNTENDLFVYTVDKSWYFLVSGRWFRAASPQGPWTFASDKLPADFAKIPANHPRAAVRASVPGTPEAREALMLAQAPHKVEVKRSEVKVDVVYSGEPQFKTIEGTTLAYAVNTAFDVIKVGSRYYTCYQAVWFTAADPKGPWTVADSVPKEIYTIPPSNPKYNVTYVTVYESTPSTVTVGYTAGYMGAFILGACVVYGTGYHYPPYWYYPPGIHYPVYYPRPYSYGCAAAYNPYTGTYARGAVAYGPYGGCGYAAAYNPYTGTYARGAAAYGPYGGRGYAEAYNPYTGAWGQKAAAYGPGGQAAYAARGYNPTTGRGGATYQRSTPYANWGQSVVTKGDEWARTGHYSDSRGTIAGYETSQGGKGVGISTDHGTTTVRQTRNDDLYATHDGNVYKKTDDGWQSYDNGSWNSVDKPTPQGKSAGTTSTSSSTRQGKSAGTTSTSSSTRQATSAGTTSTASGRAQATTAGSASGRSSASSNWSRNSQQLQRDQQARATSTQRTKSYDSWSSRAGSGGSRKSSGSSSGSRGGRRR
ncbi:MAG: hypothetical protein KA419_13090 [Acidobacteria bacterium]|nr:hypothetical protein [Acidobacteriota bacterium]